MSEGPESSRRRHILSSINPEDELAKKRRKRSPNNEPASPRPAANQHADAGSYDNSGTGDGTESTQPRRSRLKLKSEKRRRHRSRDDRGDGDDRREHTGSSRRRHRHHHRRRHRSPTPPNPYEAPPLDPDAAFRESLFDAMADDEGATYWENVYGQPVHGYSNDKVGPAGELEKMSDDEYAEYVRRKMWEKTHAGLMEERARREEERKKKAAEDRHNRKLQEEMERSLLLGERRRARKNWKQRWDEYQEAWSGWDGSPDSLAWPVESGKRDDVSEKAVRDFFVHGPNVEELGEVGIAAKLKDERVRWHPDKIQQKLGGTVTTEIMKDVTAIFQIIDKLWGETRRQK